MKKIKEIAKNKNLALSALAFDARQKMINKMAEGSIIMKTFPCYTMATVNILHSRKMQVAKNNQDIFSCSHRFLLRNSMYHKKIIDKFFYPLWRMK